MKNLNQLRSELTVVEEQIKIFEDLQRQLKESKEERCLEIRDFIKSEIEKLDFNDILGKAAYWVEYALQKPIFDAIISANNFEFNEDGFVVIDGIEYEVYYHADYFLVDGALNSSAHQDLFYYKDYDRKYNVKRAEELEKIKLIACKYYDDSDYDEADLVNYNRIYYATLKKLAAKLANAYIDGEIDNPLDKTILEDKCIDALLYTLGPCCY